MPTMPPWTQSPRRLSSSFLCLPVPKQKTSSTLTSKSVKLIVLGQELLCGDFFYPVKPDDSTWELEDEAEGDKYDSGWPRPGSTFRGTAASLAVDERHAPRIRGHDRRSQIRPHHVRPVRQRISEDVRKLPLPLHRREGKRQAGQEEVGSAAQAALQGPRLFPRRAGLPLPGGDIARHPENLGGWSIYGGAFDDEGFKVKHKGAGDLLMAHGGLSNNNHSQFAVAMNFLTEFETKHVIFGKVLDGMDVLRVMELEGSGEGTTSKRITIVDCGELDEAGNRIDAVGVAAQEKEEGQAVAEGRPRRPL